MGARAVCGLAKLGSPFTRLPASVACARTLVLQKASSEIIQITPLSMTATLSNCAMKLGLHHCRWL